MKTHFDSPFFLLRVEKAILQGLMYACFIGFLVSLTAAAIGYYHQFIMAGMALVMYYVLRNELQETYGENNTYQIYREDLVNGIVPAKTLKYLRREKEATETLLCDAGECIVCDNLRSQLIFKSNDN